jgi:hypothetical protein
MCRDEGKLLTSGGHLRIERAAKKLLEHDDAGVMMLGSQERDMHIPTRLMGSHERVNVAARRRSFILSIAAPTLAITTTVTADYQGLQVQLHTSTVLGGASRDVYRVYAMFSDPEDYVNGVFGSPTLGNMTIRTLSSTGTPPGGSFVNVNAPGGGGATAPQAGAIVANPPLQWDTFVTIGLAVVPSGVTDVTTLSPGFTGIGNVPALDTNNAGWFLLGSGITQGSAGNGIVFCQLRGNETIPSLG